MVMNCLPRRIPRKPCCRIKRSTVQRATMMSSRARSRQILRAPLIPRPSLRSQNTRSICTTSSASLTDRAEAGRFLKA